LKILKLITTVLFFTGIYSTNALSAEHGWYTGFGIASTKTDLATPRIDKATAGTQNSSGFDDDSLAIAFNGGYRLNDHVALNIDFFYTKADMLVNYTSEEIGGTTDNSLEITADSYYLTPGVHAIYPINKSVEVYAKFGLSIILSDIENRERTLLNPPPFTTTDDTVSFKDWAIVPTYGIGGLWHFGTNWSAVAEYTLTDFDIIPVTSSTSSLEAIDYKMSYLLLGLRYNFN
jgi:opacity protein-like surface antigen